MGEREDILRNLALHDERIITSVLATDLGVWDMSCSDARTHALVRLGALIALDAPVVAYQSCIDLALAVGATADDIVNTLISVAPIAGAARVVAAAPAIALAIGYDIDAALEAYNGSS